MKQPAHIPTHWPEPLADHAFYGLAGDIVRTIEPHTEADSAALLVQLLVAFGNIINKGPHWQAEADRHALNLFAVVVGETSKGRKGTSWKHVHKLASYSDEIWKTRVQSGLSSGEGLIHAVRDPSEVDADGKQQDAGPLDSRLLAIETEFASVLRMIARDGNTLSPVIRQAWDGETLQIITKNSPVIASNAHISIIGHVTKSELVRELTRTDAGNGFGNRFLWVCARRSKVLPDGGALPDCDCERLAEQLKQAVEFVRSLGDHKLCRDDEARILWYSIYAELSEGKRGLFGAVTSRAEAQVMRLACLYALLDKSPEVRQAHLLAALAVWKYCADSARYIFGDALGDPLADELLRMLRTNQHGMTRTDISAAFGRNKAAGDISRALGFLEEDGLAKSVNEATEGRSAQRWLAVGEGSTG